MADIYKEVSQEEFNEAYEQHQLWLKDRQTGERMRFDNRDLRNIDFTDRKRLLFIILENCLLDEVDLNGVTLNRASLSNCSLQRIELYDAAIARANLNRVNLVNANLVDVNLRYSSLIGAKLDGANLDGANFDGANLTNATGLPNSLISSNVVEEYQSEIRRLEKERLEFLKDSQNKTKELEENRRKQEALQEDVNRLQGSQDESNILKQRINDTFTTLDTNVSIKIRREQEALETMCKRYGDAIICLVAILVVLWAHFFIKLDVGTITDLGGMWLHVSPSVLLVSFIVLCVFQIHKCRRQLLAISELLYNHELIRSNMNAIIDINGDDNLEQSIEKVTAIFDRWASQIISSSQTIDDAEKRKCEIEKKDATGQEQAVNLILEFMKKYNTGS